MLLAYDILFPKRWSFSGITAGPHNWIWHAFQSPASPIHSLSSTWIIQSAIGYRAWENIQFKGKTLKFPGFECAVMSTEEIETQCVWLSQTSLIEARWVNPVIWSVQHLIMTNPEGKWLKRRKKGIKWKKNKSTNHVVKKPTWLKCHHH